MEKVSSFKCGPSSEKCQCKCPDGPCGHDFKNGPVKYWDKNGNEVPSQEGATSGSVCCAKCGMDKMSHDLWVLP
jgi:hypothetical protein